MRKKVGEINLSEYGVCHVFQLEYYNGNTAIKIESAFGEPIATVSTNIPNSNNLKKGTFHVQPWNWSDDFQEELLKSNIFEVVDPVGIPTGFVISPIWRLNETT